MRIAVVYVPARDKARIEAAAKAMAREFEKKGYMTEVGEARPEETPRLTGFDYVVFGTESSSLFGKIPERVAAVLAQAGMLAGKRSMSFVRKSGLGSEKALARLMKAMEAEGMVVNCAELVSSEEEAARAARGAPVERN